MSQTVSAVFLNPDAAERAIGALEDHGISQDRISVVTGEGQASAGGAVAPAGDAPSPGSRAPQTAGDEFMEVQTEDPPTPTDMNYVTEARLGGSEDEVSIVEAEGKHGITTTTPADAAKGAVEGSVVGLGVGLLAGVAALFVPGVGPVLAAGPLWAALGGAVGATAAGAVAGGVTGYLRDMGVSDAAASHYAHALSRGSVIVSVFMDETAKVDEVEAVLAKYGGSELALH